MDYRNSFDDKKIILYGHNTKKGKAPFKVLEKYINKDFYLNHEYINISNDNINYNYKIFSILIVDGTSDHMKLLYNKDDFYNYLVKLKDDSIYDTDVDIDKGDKILILQTCYYNPDNTYLLIIARKENE